MILIIISIYICIIYTLYYVYTYIYNVYIYIMYKYIYIMYKYVYVYIYTLYIYIGMETTLRHGCAYEIPVGNWGFVTGR